MKVLDLFSGIGGFSLGLERAGMETIAFCEFDKHAQQVLNKHWPHIPIHEDIRELDGNQFRGSVDVVCGGFPCQDLSGSGLQKGFGGERSSLYREMLRIISECRPRYAIFENVTGLLTGENGRWFAKFLYDLAEIGFDAEWHCISASELGAPHHRDRVWIIAYATSQRFQRGIEGSIFDKTVFSSQGGKPLRVRSKGRLGNWSNEHWEVESRMDRVANGIQGRAHRIKQLGNSVVPQIPEAIGRAIMQTD